MFAVPKKSTDEMWLVVNYKKLNDITVSDPYHMPRMEVVREKMGRAKIFTTVDLRKGYYQVPLNDRDKEKTSFITEFGKYQFKVMPFGMKNTPATFQHLMDTVLDDTHEFARCYLDNICIFSMDWNDHLDHLKDVLRRLQEAGLTVNPRKCKLGAKTVEFLGHTIGEGAISPQAQKVQAIIEYATPKTKRDVRSFLGIVNSYSDFMRDCSDIAAPTSQTF